MSLAKQPGAAVLAAATAAGRALQTLPRSAKSRSGRQRGQVQGRGLRIRRGAARGCSANVAAARSALGSGGPRRGVAGAAAATRCRALHFPAPSPRDAPSRGDSIAHTQFAPVLLPGQRPRPRRAAGGDGQGSKTRGAGTLRPRPTMARSFGQRKLWMFVKGFIGRTNRCRILAYRGATKALLNSYIGRCAAAPTHTHRPTPQRRRLQQS